MHTIENLLFNARHYECKILNLMEEHVASCSLVDFVFGKHGQAPLHIMVGAHDHGNSESPQNSSKGHPIEIQ